MTSVLIEAAPRPAPVPAPPAPPGRQPLIRAADLLWLSIPVVFGLWMLRAELLILPYPNDSAMHQQMVRWAAEIIEMGRSPLTGWFPYLQLGSPQFAHYQSLPHLLTAFVGVVVGAESAFHWTLYLLVALWPVSVFITARLFSLGRGAALGAAFLAPLVSSEIGLGYEWTSYVWGGPGVWSQLWGMILAGPALALSWRAVRGTGSLAAAAALTGVSVAMHFQTGYMALVSLAIWVLAAPSELWRRLLRGAAVAGGALLTVAWVIFPLVRDNAFLNRTVADARVDHDSYGAARVLGWLVNGGIFDGRRWPVLTTFFAVGLGVLLVRWRRDENARALVGLFAFMLVLFCGRPTFGPLLDLIPGMRDMFLTRFVSGVHLAGILVIGAGAAWIVETLLRGARRLSKAERLVAVPFVVVAAIIVMLAPVGERTLYALRDREWLDDQSQAEKVQGAEMDVLVEMAQRRGGGRIYSGSRTGWGDDYAVLFVSGPDRLVDHDSDSIGLVLRTPSLSSDIETAFDENNPAQYDLLNIRYLIYPESRKPSVPATFLARSGGHVLWEVATTGYLKVVDTLGSIEADNHTVLAANRAFLSSGQLARGIHPTVAFAGKHAEPPTLSSDAGVTDAPGRLSSQFDDGLIGTYGGRVEMARRGVVMLKSTFDPGWTATVDGVRRTVFMVAPTLVGVEVGPGEHQVRFEYRPSTNYPLLFAVGAAAFAVLFVLDRRRPRWIYGRDAELYL